jgi:hypothetical protein
MVMDLTFNALPPVPARIHVPERLINPPYILKPPATAERFSVSGTAKSVAGDQNLCARQATEFTQTSVMNWSE